MCVGKTHLHCTKKGKIILKYKFNNMFGKRKEVLPEEDFRKRSYKGKEKTVQ